MLFKLFIKKEKVIHVRKKGNYIMYFHSLLISDNLKNYDNCELYPYNK
jgi:hypothetical protein